jgi:hypothetical protein
MKMVCHFFNNLGTVPVFEIFEADIRVYKSCYTKWKKPNPSRRLFISKAYARIQGPHGALCPTFVFSVEKKNARE